ncbi:MAG: DUF5916 domain-containing protein [Acidobacteriota bacterium]|nr:DUF5916 domain-containing protein [Acidobacteriota bacterium]
MSPRPRSARVGLWQIPRPGLLVASACVLLAPPVTVGAGPQLTPPASDSPARVAKTAGERAARSTRSVFLIPFANRSEDPANDWLSVGIAETVAADFHAAGFAVDTVEPRPSASALPTTDIFRAAHAAGAGSVITGSYEVVGSLVRITGRLVDVASELVAETVTVVGSLDELFSLQDRIVAGLKTSVRAEGPVLGGDGGAGSGAFPIRAGEFLLRGPDDGRWAEPPVARPGPRRSSEALGGGAPLIPVAPVTETGAATSAGILTGRPILNARRANQPPTIDGALDDLVWQTATRITDFVQVVPAEGASATEATEVFVAFDSTHLYLGMYAHYSNPGMVRANRVDRDRASFGDDTISFYFDTFLDQQRAFVFTLNGYGVQGDSLLGGGRGGGFSGVPRGDRSWDALFDSGGTLVDDGWQAEVAIPFKSLRYPSTDGVHRWGFQVARSIRDKNETVVWAPVSRDVSGFLPQMGLLDGLSGLSTSRNLEILPTVTAIQAGSLDRATGDFTDERQPEGGVNFKYGLTSNLTVDFTYNPDFSQIESDRPQIEVNQRFPLFFSELRPFFLEGQEIFDIRGPVNFIHTRTIVDPRYGGKLTGKVGKTTLGLLVANDEAPGNLDDPSDPVYGRTANTLIGRVRYDLYSESHIGAIFTDRGFMGSYSRLAGVDSRFRLSPRSFVDFAAITTQNRDLDGNETTGPMLDAGYRHSGRNLAYRASYYSIDPAFDTEVGFVRRRDIRRMRTDVSYRWWPENWLINWGPEFDYSRNWNFDDVLVDEEARLRMRMTFAKNISFRADVRREMERFGGINFDKTRFSYSGNVSASRLFSFGGSYFWGDQIRYTETPFLGEGSSGSVFMSLRPFSRLQSSMNINTSRLFDPLGESEVFDVKIYRALTTYQFTDRLLLRNILQHNSFSGTLGANLLVTYRVNSGTVFFIGYDDRYQQGDMLLDENDEPVYFTTDFQRTNRAFFTKISYLFRY